MVQLLVLAGVALAPLYLWESGLPQVSHILAAVALLGRLITRPRLHWQRGWGSAAAFVAHAFVVDLVAFLRYGDVYSVFAPLYYLYGFLVFLLLVTLADELGGHFLRRLFWIHLLGLFVVTVSGLLGFGRVYAGSRAMGFSNDPNQMAHWAMWAAVIVGATGRAVFQSWAPGLVGFVVALLATILAASRSATVGIAALGLVYAGILLASAARGARLRFRRRAAHGIVLILLLVVGLSCAIALSAEWRQHLAGQVAFWIGRFFERDLDDTLEGRGYDRLWKFPEYLVFGAGEGANHRYASRSVFLGEIHSTWAGLLFNYGAIGASFLLAFLLLVLRGTKGTAFRLLVLGPWLYGFTTYGLRNWYFWVGLAVVYAASRAAAVGQRQVAPAVSDPKRPLGALTVLPGGGRSRMAGVSGSGALGARSC